MGQQGKIGWKWQPSGDGTAAYWRSDGTVWDTIETKQFSTWCVQEISKLNRK